MKVIATILACVGVLVVPATASAHDATVSVKCVHNNAVGTYTYKNFPNNGKADMVLWINGHQAKYGQATGLGTAPKTFTLEAPLVPGRNSVGATTAWNTFGHQGFVKTYQDIVCDKPTPTPTPEPPVVTPTPEPPTTPPVPPAPPVPPVTPPTPPVPPKVCPDTSADRYKITVTPRHATHGRVTFKLKGPHVRKVRWYVDLKRRGVSGVRWETLSGKGDRTYRVYLFSKEVWGPALWGEHWVTVRATVGPKGCGHSVSKKLKFFNNDPPLARTSRSSWG